MLLPLLNQDLLIDELFIGLKPAFFKPFAP